MDQSLADPSPRLRFAATASALPAQRWDTDGARQVDYRRIVALAMPLFLNSSVQALLNLTDTWFIGRISATATAAMGSTYFLVLVFIILAGGIGMGVQTLVAHAYGARRKRQAAATVWAGLWGSAATLPIFVLLAHGGRTLLQPFGLPGDIETLACEYWLPRMLGGPVAVAMWVISGFFNGIGRTRVTLALSAGVALVNGALNAIFIFGLDMGIAGAAWATTASLALGTAAGLILFTTAGVNAEYASRVLWRPRRRRVARAVSFGVPMGLAVSMDLLALAVFQIMQSKLGAVTGAATQIAMMLTSTCYMPAVGLGLAGTTLVGQSIGAGDKEWARTLGNATIRLTLGYMGLTGVALAAVGPWLLPLFITETDPSAAAVIRLGTTLLWLAACYQGFDGLNIGASFCLRGAGDARVPAILVLGLAWGLYLPLAHSLTFSPGEGWIEGLPQYGLGAVGGWCAAIAYVMALGTALWWRWRTGAWQRLRLR
jgi:multidrug resistance protein, MATE family